MPAQLLLTPALADSLADAVEHGVPIETAAQAAGVSKSQFYDWLQAGSRGTWSDGSPITQESLRQITEFSEKIRAAQASHEARLIRDIDAASQAVNAKTGIPEWRAGAWLANNHPRMRATYRQERVSQVEQTGTVRHEHTLAKALDPHQLEQAYQALNAQPDEPAGSGT